MAWQADQPVYFTLMPKKRALQHKEEEEAVMKEEAWFQIWNLNEYRV